MHVSEEEQSQINRLVAELEATSGIQVLIVIVSRADAYPQVPWKGIRDRNGFQRLARDGVCALSPGRCGDACRCALIVADDRRRDPRRARWPNSCSPARGGMKKRRTILRPKAMQTSAALRLGAPARAGVRPGARVQGRAASPEAVATRKALAAPAAGSGALAVIRPASAFREIPS